jgi:hypothetical protein
MAPLGPHTLAPYLRLWQSKYDTGPSQLPLVVLLLVSGALRPLTYPELGETLKLLCS